MGSDSVAAVVRSTRATASLEDAGIRTTKDLARTPVSALLPLRIPHTSEQLLARWRALSILVTRLGFDLREARRAVKTMPSVDDALVREGGDRASAALARALQRGRLPLTLETLGALGSDVDRLRSHFEDLFALACASPEAMADLEEPARAAAVRWQPVADLIALAGADPVLANALAQHAEIRGVAQVMALGDESVLARVNALKARGILPKTFLYLPLPRPVLPPALRPSRPDLDVRVMGGIAFFEGRAEPGALVRIVGTSPGEDGKKEIAFGTASDDGRFLLHATLDDGTYRASAQVALAGEPLWSEPSAPSEIAIARSRIGVSAASLVAGAPGTEIRIVLDQPIMEQTLASARVQVRSRGLGGIGATAQLGDDGRILVLRSPTAPAPKDVLEVVAAASAAEGPCLPRVLATLPTGERPAFEVTGVTWPGDASLLDALHGDDLTLRIDGLGFHHGIRVSAWPLHVLDQRVVSDTTIICAVRPDRMGTHDLVLSDPFGTVVRKNALRVGAPERTVRVDRMERHVNGALATISVLVPPEQAIWNARLESAPGGRFGVQEGYPSAREVVLPDRARVVCFDVPVDFAEALEIGDAEDVLPRAILAFDTWEASGDREGRVASARGPVENAARRANEPDPAMQNVAVAPGPGGCSMSIEMPSEPIYERSWFNVRITTVAEHVGTLVVKPQRTASQRKTDIPWITSNPTLAVPVGKHVFDVKLYVRSLRDFDPIEVELLFQLFCPKLAQSALEKVIVSKKKPRCGITKVTVSPERPRVGDSLSIQVEYVADGPTRLTIGPPDYDHRGDVRGVADYQATPGGGPQVSNWFAAAPGLVHIEVMLWCQNGWSRKQVYITIEDASPPGPQGGNPQGGLPAPNKPGGAGAGLLLGPSSGQIDHCGRGTEPGAPVAYGDRLHGRIDKPGDHAVFAFTGQAGDFVTVRSVERALSAADEVKVHFSLFDGKGAFLIAGALIGQGTERAISGFPLPADDRYVIVVCVDTSRSSRDTGRFMLDLERDDVVQVDAPSNDWAPHDGTIRRVGDVVVFSFSARKNTFLDVDLSGGQARSGWGFIGKDFVPVFDVFSPSGKDLVGPDSPKQLSIYEGIYLPEDGTYFLRVGAVSGVSPKETGSFSVRIRATPIQPLMAGNPVRFGGVLAAEYEVKVFEFDRASLARWYIDVQMSASTSVAAGAAVAFVPPQLRLIDPDGQVLLAAAATFATRDVPLRVDGLHHIVVSVDTDNMLQGLYSPESFSGEIVLEPHRR